MNTLLVSLVNSVLESNGEFALFAISNCAESLERLRLVNSGEESVRLLTDLNGNIEQSEQTKLF